MFGPKTKAEAREWKYGPPYDGKAYSDSRCAYNVFPPGRWGSYQCLRKPGHGPDKLYCKQHAKKVGDE